VDFNITDQLLIKYSALVIYWRKNEYNGTVHQVFVDFEKTYDSVKREVLCNIPTQLVIPMKLVTPLKTFLSESYNKVHTGENV